MTPGRTLPQRLRASLWAIALIGLLPCSARAADSPAQLLAKEYDRLTKYSDFESFTLRMDKLRALGDLGTPEAAKALVRIVRDTKRIDDEVTAIIALGPGLNLATAKELAEIVERRKGSAERVHALGMAYALATRPYVLRWLAGDALHARNEGILQAALDAQYMHADPKALKRLIEIYEEHYERKRGMDLAFSAVRALGSIGEQGGEASGDVRRFLMRAVAHPDPRVRLAAADVMARQVPMDVNVRGAVRHLLGDEVSVVREAAASAVAYADLEEMIPFVADLLDDRHIKTRDVAHKALVKLTGKDLGFEADAWKVWFKHRTESASPVKRTPSTSGSTYYGMGVHSDRVLFIVDLSGSMAFPWGQDTTRIDIARAELAKVLEKLDSNTLFNIIVFSDKVHAWRKGEVLATPDARKRALKWIDKAFKEPRGGTYMHAALKKAFSENQRIDTIFLLTDGLATDGEPIVPEAILASVSAWNRYRRVVIHTIALTLEDLDEKGMPERHLSEIKKFMRQLARLTGGVAKVVTDLPPGYERPEKPK